MRSFSCQLPEIDFADQDGFERKLHTARIDSEAHRG
jgi:hypothetical protein